jgi:hypothetical protein
MNLRLLFGLTTALLFFSPFERVALAQSDQAARPVIVQYVAPPECGSNVAFQVLLKTEIARSPNPARPWRFSVRIVRQPGSYEGTLTTETGVRQVTANRCDDVTSAFAVIIAMAEPEPQLPPPPAPPPTPAAVAPPPPPVLLPIPQDQDPPRGDEASPLEWRLGARALGSNHGSGTVGGFGFGSVELPWGFRKMMFEIGVGALSGGLGATSQASGSGMISYVVLDTQACLIDLPIAQTGLSVLGCLRLAGASFKAGTQGGGAFWTGGGPRLRWQTPVRVFVEVNFDAMYGTVSSGEGNDAGWIDAGLSLGFRL